MNPKQTQRFVAIHGHFYQPPRENPWTGAIEAQSSAAPDHDWNERIALQCYAPNAASRILSAHGRIEAVVNNYEYMSFNMGPTLLSWIRFHLPETYAAIQAADRRSAERLGGHGNAMAQVYNHIIMPLATPQDRLTQIRWGARDFEFHFGRRPEGMWLAETAINMDTVVDLIREGIRFTVLSPFQADSFRTMVGGEWVDCGNGDIDTSKAYRILPLDADGKRICEGHLDVFFYHPSLSSAVGFEHLLRSAGTFADRIESGFDPLETGPQLVPVATDGESYGHHEPFGDMCAAYLFERMMPERGMVPVNFGWYLEQFPPVHEVRLKNAHGEGCAWSCAHGVGRWYRDCGCSTGAPDGWNQKWRGPLRDAFDIVKRVADQTLLHEWSRISDKNAWAARDAYIDVLLHPGNRKIQQSTLAPWLRDPTDSDALTLALRLLEIQKYCMFSYTSCGWFFNDIAGIEPEQNMRYALRALELLGPLAAHAHSSEREFLVALSKAVSNIDGRNGAEILEQDARPRVPPALKLVAEAAARRHLGLGDNTSTEMLAEIDLAEVSTVGRAHIYRGKCVHSETHEVLECAAVLHTDTLNRVDILLVEGASAYKSLNLPESGPIDLRSLQMRMPQSYGLRLRDLGTDSLSRLNRIATREGMARATTELRDFPGRHGLALDGLADPTGSLPEALRAPLVLSLAAAVQTVVLKALRECTGELLLEAKLLMEETQELGITLQLGGLGRMFHLRIAELIIEAGQDHSEEIVRQITSLITLGDWLKLDFGKTRLENLAWPLYLLYTAQPRSDLRRLRPMFEWLNFEFPESRKA